MELLAAVCLVRGGHAKVIEAVDNFKRENREHHRFECLVKRFMEHRSVSTEFQLVCMNFINIIVHSAEDVNFRVHLQYEFTELGLDEYLEVCPCTTPTLLINNYYLFTVSQSFTRCGSESS